MENKGFNYNAVNKTVVKVVQSVNKNVI
ncbi:hypothetical protein MTBPR1_10309 [Candidatus Terasakiella magnetica]|uniref:Uncharacterized protein n=1 Tax=Candidatus Terasakiella magnetica TaxID=1867952 RepID=A0A1C3RCW7_9PROT|nr:hypothetical protein MTBPR1_10309 [Candidatus Terasakiella magnetica]